MLSLKITVPYTSIGKPTSHPMMLSSRIKFSLQHSSSAHHPHCRLYWCISLVQGALWCGKGRNASQLDSCLHFGTNADTEVDTLHMHSSFFRQKMLTLANELKLKLVVSNTSSSWDDGRLATGDVCDWNCPWREQQWCCGRIYRQWCWGSCWLAEVIDNEIKLQNQAWWEQKEIMMN